MEQFDSSLYAVCDRLRSFLRFLPPDIKKSVSEIRLRKNRPLSLTVNGKTFFVNKNGYIEGALSGGGVTVLNSDINESFRLLCASSAFAHEEELKEGFVSLKNGCRAGICGTLNANGFMRDITSINIRIAREIHGCADYILNYYKGQGLLIAGPPCSGKTTVLRELVRKLSNGDGGKFYRTAVIDSRLEISGGGICDLGACCDVLVSPDKAKGCEIALRTMFPDIIAFDEIGTAAELCRIKESFFSGVSVITTAHAGSSEELMERQVTRALLESGAIAQVALLPHKMGENPRILDTKELFYADAV